MQDEIDEKVREFQDIYEFQMDGQVIKDARELLIVQQSTAQSETVEDVLKEKEKETYNEKANKLNMLRLKPKTMWPNMAPINPNGTTANIRKGVV